MFEAELTEGFITLRVDTAQLDKALAQKNKEVEALEKSLTPATAMLKETERRPLTNELKKASQSWGNLSKGFDKFVKGWDSFNKKIDETTKKISGFAIGGGAVGAGAVGLATSASPLAASTLSGSIQLLTTTVGSTFLPLVKQLSFALQDAAKYWRNLNPEIKENILQITKMIAVAGVAAAGLAAVNKVLLFISRNPLVALGAAAVGGAFALAEHQNKVGEKIADLQQKNTFGINEKETLNDQTSRELAGMKPEEAKKEAVRQMDLTFKEFNRMNEKLEDFRSGQGNLMGMVAPGRNNQEERLIAATGNALGEFEKAKIRANKFAFDNKMERLVPEEKADEHKMGAQLPLPTTFAGPEELWKSIQQAAVSSPLENEVLNAQLENNRQFEKANRTLEQIRDSQPVRK